MGTPKDVYSPFLNRGLVLKSDPALLEAGQYAQLTNMDSPLEGVLTTRQGTLQCYNLPANVVQFLHTITRLVIPNATTAHYIGIDGLIYRSNSPVGAGMSFVNMFGVTALPVSGINVMLQRFETADYGAEGQTLIYKFFATLNGNFKDNGAFAVLQNWGIFAPTYPATASNSGSGTGPVAFTGAETPYTYVYTYENGISGAESNPSVVMPASIGVTPNGTAISVVVTSTSQSQVTKINIYRAGGSLTDGLYRYAGFVFNNSVPSAITWPDTNQDQDIIDNQLLSTDHDPPVPSGLPITFDATTYTTGAAGTVIHATYTVNTGPSGFKPRNGDLLQISNGSRFELAYCIGSDSSTDANKILFYTQIGQPNAPYEIVCTTRTGGFCQLALFAFSSIFLAGDPNNPNFLYQSKPNEPEYFPVIQQNTGIIQSIAVGTPSNPINGITEYAGAIICLNAQTIFSVSVFNNQMQQPVPTPARHGLITKQAWVKVTNAIWYLSYDGIYSFTGGQETWMSEAIDPLFKGVSINGYLPINMTPGQGANNPPTGLDIITMTTIDNKVYMVYSDTAGNYNRLVYEIPFQRWHIETFYYNQGYALTAQFSEPDVGYSWLGISRPTTPYNIVQLDLTKQGTSDGWNIAPDQGTEIAYYFSPTVIDQQAKTDKLFSDFQVETQSTLATTTANVQYDWSGVNDGIDVFTIPSGVRQRWPFVLQQQGSNGPEGKYAYAMQLLFSGITTGQANFYTLGLHYEDLADFRQGLSQDYSDLGYADSKTFRSITVEIDTGGVQAYAFLDVDSQTSVAVFPITTNYFNRKVILSVPSFITGQMARLRFLPGPGGKTNLYTTSEGGGIVWDYEKLPASLTHFDSNTIAPFNGYSFWKQFWLYFECSSQVVLTIYTDNDAQFWLEIIPPQPVRGTYRFYLPSVNNGVLNKSKVKRFTIDSATPFRFYADASKVEWLPCGADQRADYQQLTISELMQPQ